jgi:hypothetical protein
MKVLHKSLSSILLKTRVSESASINKTISCCCPFDLGDGGRDLAHAGHGQLLYGDHRLELGAHRLQDRVQLHLLT